VASLTAPAAAHVVEARAPEEVRRAQAPAAPSA
jgi:hypothetical protein